MLLLKRVLALLHWPAFLPIIVFNIPAIPPEQQMIIKREMGNLGFLHNSNCFMSAATKSSEQPDSNQLKKQS